MATRRQAAGAAQVPDRGRRGGRQRESRCRSSNSTRSDWPATCVVISDTCQFGPGQPAITYGLRGISYYELRLTGPKQDLHSGTFGGARGQSGQRAVRDAGGLDERPGPGAGAGLLRRRRSALAARAQRVRRAAVRRAAVHGANRRQRARAAKRAITTLERRWARPTFDINGLTSGYQGEGAKTVLPARASAKFSFRLVPKQDPKKISAGPGGEAPRAVSAGHSRWN